MLSGWTFVGGGRSRILVGAAAAAALGVFTPGRVEAHFKLTAPACWMSQDTEGGPQKNGPCAAVPNTGLGDVAGTPTKMVSAFSPGQTIPVTVTATIGHPGWYRVALVEGASASQTLTTLPDPKAQAGTNCTPPIMTNPVWSTTQPIIADGLGLPAGSTNPVQQTGTKTFQVTIPANASCTAAKPCTLQVIMVMTDHPANDCYYHHCADISTQSGGSDDGGAPKPDAGKGGSGGGGTGGSSGSKDGGAGSTGAGGSSAGGAGGAAGSTTTGMAGSSTTGMAGSTSSGTGGSSGGGAGGDVTGGSGGATGSTSGTTTGGSTGQGGSSNTTTSTTNTSGTSSSSSSTSGSQGTGGASTTGGTGAGPGMNDNGCSCGVVGRAPNPYGVLAGLFAVGLLRRRRRQG